MSFISLRLVLPPLRRFPSAEVIALAKPQFEAGREEVGKGGIIGGVRLQRRIVARVTNFAEEAGFHVLGEILSPITVQKGNREYLVNLRHQNCPSLKGTPGAFPGILPAAPCYSQTQSNKC